VDASSEAAGRFFDLTDDAKLTVAPKPWNPDSPNQYRGYFPSSVNGKEGFDIGDPQLGASMSDLLERSYYELNQFPRELGVEFEESVADYFESISRFGRVLMEAILASVGGVPETVADAFIRPQSLSTLRFNGYPAHSDPVSISEEDGAPLACEIHVDSGLLTILYQADRGGLQVRDQNRRWHDVSCDRGAFVVNTGLALARITGGAYPATPHRVLLAEEERLSIPFFLEPRFDCDLAPTAFGLQDISTTESVTYETFLRESLAKFVEYRRG